MARTIAIWIFGLLAGAIIGGFAGIIAGHFADMPALWSPSAPIF